MGNPLGPDTVNLSLNLTLAERAHLARLAVEADRSIGAVVRDLIVEGLRHTKPEIAVEIEQHRKARRMAMLAAACAMIALGAALVTAFSGTDKEPSAPAVCAGE